MKRLSKTFLPKYIWNRYLLVRDYLKGKVISNGLPNEVTIEMTNFCNLNCIMCPRDKMKRGVGFIKESLFKKIVDEIEDYVELLDLNSFGEPLFHPKAIDMIRYASEKNLLTYLSTNLTILDEKKSREIINSGLDTIILSFDGATKGTYERIRKGSNYENALENLETFLEIKEEMGSRNPFTVLQMVYMKDTQKEIDMFLEKFKNSSANIIRLKPYMALDMEKEWMSVLPSTITNKPCIMLWRRLTVFWDGIVVPCCYAYDKDYILGDANKQTLREIWNGKAMVALRRKHLEGKQDEISLCKGCKPFQSSLLLTLGSIFVDNLTAKKILWQLDKLVVKGKTKLVKYV